MNWGGASHTIDEMVHFVRERGRGNFSWNSAPYTEGRYESFRPWGWCIRHAGYPLAAQMGKCLAAWINTLPPEHQYRSCLEQIAELYGGLENFESILADLMTAAPGSRAASLGVTRPYLLSDLKEALRDHFDSIRSAPAPLYDRLARVLRQGDLVITFNYDLGVERALRAAGLWDIRTGYGFSIESCGTAVARRGAEAAWKHELACPLVRRQDRVFRRRWKFIR